MPTHPSENVTDKIKRTPSDIVGKTKADKDKAYEQSRNYGFSQGANMDTQKEETEEQEYTADGLPRTQKYSYDKIGRSHDRDSNR